MSSSSASVSYITGTRDCVRSSSLKILRKHKTLGHGNKNLVSHQLKYEAKEINYYIKPCHLSCSRGGSKISEKGVHLYKGVGVGFAAFISFFLNIHQYQI